MGGACGGGQQHHVKPNPLEASNHNATGQEYC